MSQGTIRACDPHIESAYFPFLLSPVSPETSRLFRTEWEAAGGDAKNVAATHIGNAKRWGGQPQPELYELPCWSTNLVIEGLWRSGCGQKRGCPTYRTLLKDNMVVITLPMAMD